MQQKRIADTLSELFNDAKYDKIKMAKGAAKSIFRPMQPADFKDAYLSISKEQGEDLVQLIVDNGFKNIVEFGTSFGISTLFLAQAVLQTQGHIITTELLASKAQRATENFIRAGVADIIEVRVGDATETLKGHKTPIDLLLLDGWKDLYLPIFRMLEPNFHSDTIIYVDNANMAEVKEFLAAIAEDHNYELQPIFDNKAVLISKVK